MSKRIPGDPVKLVSMYTKSMPVLTRGVLVLTEGELYFQVELHKSKCKRRPCHGMGSMLYAGLGHFPYGCVDIEWDSAMGRALVIAALRFTHERWPWPS